MELVPKSISSTDYHDARLVGIESCDQSATIKLRTTTRKDVAIELDGLHWFFATDVMASNIVERVDAHDITNENVSSVFAAFQSTGSEYFTQDAIKRANLASLVGSKFLSIHPTYGAYVLAVCATITERDA